VLSEFLAAIESVKREFLHRQSSAIIEFTTVAHANRVFDDPLDH
jgi:hypothetical protein